MKKLLFTLATILFINSIVLSQIKAPDASKDTIINNIPQKVFIGSKGGKYILMVSKKTGKEYKKYLKAKVI